MFIGRESELSSLNKLFDKKSASLVVCKGRRRIGKSSLIEQFGLRAENFFQFQGLGPRENMGNQDQLQNFSFQLHQQFSLPRVTLADWSEAFSLLASQTTQGQVVILLDEISWMGSHDKDFCGKLKIAWDIGFKKNPNLILVLCGSVSSWIQENILKDTNFVGRISQSITLRELPLSVCKSFWQSQAEHVSGFEKLKLLAVTGGIPRYLEEIDPRLSAEENIKSLCFDEAGLLFDEFDRIFSSSFPKRSPKYHELILALESGHRTFTEISESLKTANNGTISLRLEELVLSGFVERDYSFRIEGGQSRISRFRLRDNYLRFYLRCIKPRKEEIKKGIYQHISLENLPAWRSIMGLQFENLINSNLPLIVDKLGIDPNSIISIAPYIQRKTKKTPKACQIDLLIHTKHDTLYLCEMKFRKSIASSVITEVKEKIRVLKRPKYTSIRPVLIYAGERSEAVEDSEYFTHQIDIAQCV